MIEFAVQSPAMPDIEDFVTLEKAAADSRVNYTVYWIRRLCQEGKIEAKKIGEGTRGQWLVYLPSLIEYVTKMDDLGTKKHRPD